MQYYTTLSSTKKITIRHENLGEKNHSMIFFKRGPSLKSPTAVGLTNENTMHHL